MTFPGLEKMEFHNFSRFSMTGYTLKLINHLEVNFDGDLEQVANTYF